MPRLFMTCLAVGCLVNLGCSQGPTTFDVSGAVTFDGQPVPAGRVDFFPDFGRGNDGPQGYAFIKNGVYDTRKGGQGHGGGPMLIKVEGFDGKSDRPGFFGTPIFSIHEIKRDLPRASSVEDLEVPASAAKGLVTPSGPSKS